MSGRVERVVVKDIVRSADHRIAKVIETVVVMEQEPADEPVMLSDEDMKYQRLAEMVGTEEPVEACDPWDTKYDHDPESYGPPVEDA
jgi:hypothetical protein